MNRTAVTALIGDVAAIALGSFLTVTMLTSTATARSTTTRHSASSLSTAPSAHPTATAASGGAAISNPTPVPAATPAALAAPVVVAPLRVLTIGGLIMNGFGLNPADAWPELLSTANGWHLTSLAFDGAGFLTPGSSNDFGQPNPHLLTATLSALTDLRTEFPDAEIIDLSTVWSGTGPPPQLADINSQMQQAVTAVGGHYLDIAQPFSEQPQLLQNDDVHPTITGQQVLATAIQTAITTDQHANAQQCEEAQKLKIMPRWVE